MMNANEYGCEQLNLRASARNGHNDAVSLCGNAYDRETQCRLGTNRQNRFDVNVTEQRKVIRLTTLTRQKPRTAIDRPTMKSRRKVSAIWALPFLAPAAILLVAFVIAPSIFGGLYAFTDWTGLGWKFDWTGFDNFVTFAKDPEAAGALLHTLVITIVVMVGQNVIGLLLALAVNTRIKSKGILRVVFFAPVIVTPVVVSYVWSFMYGPSGPINSVLTLIGVSKPPDWLGNPSLAIWSVIIVILWQFSGYLMVIYLAGLQNVPDELIEAARLDGAGSTRIFFSITLPLLRPAITIGTMLVIIGGLKTFDQVWVLTNGGPGTATQTLATAVYQTAFEFGKYGYATAIALVMTLLILIFSAIQLRLTNRRRED
jgi:raffinose/stachyose/melibiose transport system permease protein